MRSGDLASGPATTKVEPAVGTQGGRIDAALQIAGAEAGKELFVYVGMVITIAVFEKDDVRCAGDDESAIRRCDAVTRRQSICPHDGLVHDAVAIGVAQEFHGAVGFGLGFLFGLFAGLDAAHFEVELT